MTEKLLALGLNLMENFMYILNVSEHQYIKLNKYISIKTHIKLNLINGFACEVSAIRVGFQEAFLTK
jgi:hypothetical protein